MMGSPLFWDGLLVDWYPNLSIHHMGHPFGRTIRALPGRFNRKGAVGYHHRRWFACALPPGFLILLPVESCGSWWSLCHWRLGDQLLGAWQKGLRAPWWHLWIWICVPSRKCGHTKDGKSLEQKASESRILVFQSMAFGFPRFSKIVPCSLRKKIYNFPPAHGSS